MRKAVIFCVSILFAVLSGCQEKESIKINENFETKTFKRREQKEITYTQGKKDTFHQDSSIESARKSKLTPFGRLKNIPKVTTNTQEEVESALAVFKIPTPSVLDFQNRTLEMPAYPFDYENDVAALKKLYSAHNLSSVIKKSMNEIEKLSALMVYTNTFLDGGRVPTTEEKSNLTGPSAEVITRLRLEEGIGGSSEVYALLFCQLSLSAGFNARVISMHMLDDSGKFLKNDICEVFLNSYDKWTAFDPYNRATYYIRNSIPLSALEIRAFMLENRYREIIPMPGIGDFTEFVSIRENLLPRYQYIYMWRMNDVLGKSTPDSVLPWQALYQNHLVWEDGYAPVSDGGFDRLDSFNNTDHPDYPLTGVHYVTHDKSEFNWSLNHSVIHISRPTEKSIRFYFDTITPNFDHFALYVDGKQMNVKSTTDLQRIEGEYSLRSVNKFGVYGPVSNISLVI
ncbi:hypothetical protein ACFL60_08495 [Candidatus Omnitrophota bacterium]